MPDDLYSLWLKIPPHARPPDHYALLGLPRFCDDTEKIEAAAQHRLDLLDRYALNPDPVKRDACQQIMNEVARARGVLIVPQKRSAYDQTLSPGKAPAARVVMPAPILKAPLGETPVAEAPESEAPVTVAPAVSTQVVRKQIGKRAKTSQGWWIASVAAASLVVSGLVISWIVVHRNNAEDGTVAVTANPVTPGTTSESPAAPPVIPASGPTKPATLPQKIDLPQIAIAPDDVIGMGPRISAPPDRSPPVAVLPPARTVTPSPHEPSEPKKTSPPLQPPSAPPVGPPVARSLPPVPSAAEQDAAANMVNEIFADAIANAKTPQAMVETARKMIAMAARSDVEPAGRYVLLVRAGDLATQAGDLEIAMAAIDAVAQLFSFDVLQVRAHALVYIAQLVTPTRKIPGLPERVDAFITAAIEADRYDLAHRVSYAAGLAATAVHDENWLRSSRARSTEIGEAEVEYQRTVADRAALEKNPSDPDANFHLGSYLCFTKADWRDGIPHLSVGSDLTTRTLALSELDDSTTPDKLVEVADGWWNLGQNMSARRQARLKQHAADLYRRAVVGATGLAKLRARMRLDELENSQGRLVDLLPMIDTNKDVDWTGWKVTKDGLAVGQWANLVRLRYHPADEYDFRVGFTAGEKRVHMRLLLTHDGRLFGWLMGATHERGFASFYTLYDISGQGFVNRTSLEGPVLESHESHTVLVKVRKDHLMAFLDDQQLLDYEADYSKLHLNDRIDRADTVDDGLGIDVDGGPLLFTKIEVIEITGAGHPIAHRNRQSG